MIVSSARATQEAAEAYGRTARRNRRARFVRLYSRTATVLLLLVVAMGPQNSSSEGEAHPPEIDLVVVEKGDRRLKLYAGDDLIKEYRIALGSNPKGHKQQQGDGRTPEGEYVIDYRNPQSRFSLSLHISYPNEADRKSAKERGVSPGGDIFIHGLGPRFAFLGALHHLHDWTDGCIAVTNEEIREIWDLVENGTRITLRP